MPRAAKRDIQATKERKFLDKRSFVSLKGCDYLYGKDKKPRRTEIFEAAQGRCQIGYPGCKGYASWEMGEWDHIVAGRVGRCDCLGDGLTHGARWACKPCHRKRHRQGV